MSRNLLVILILWLISLVGISFFGGPVSYGFFMVLTLIPIVSLVYLILVLVRFKIYQRFECYEIVSDHVVPFYFTLQNEDIFAFSGVRITFYSDFSMIDGLDDNTEYVLLPHTEITRQTKLICRYRGEYLVGIKSVILSDYLRLFRITWNNREPLRANVVPNIIELDTIRSIDTDTVSDRESRSDLSRPDATVRDYIPGDDIRRINWKLTARTGKLAVREYTGEEKEGIALVIDAAKKSDDPVVYLPLENRILEAAISLALYFKNKNIPVSVFSMRRDIREFPVDSAQTFETFYRAMASLSFDSAAVSASRYAALSEHAGVFDSRIVFIITAEVNAEAVDTAKRVNDQGGDVVIYHVTGEQGDAGEPVEVSPHTRIVQVPAGAKLGEVL